jgi:phenylalanine-4-hydroxylase
MNWKFWKKDPRSPFTPEEAYKAALRVLNREGEMDDIFMSYAAKCKRIAAWREWADAQEDIVVSRAYQNWLDYFQRKADRREKDRIESDKVDETVMKFPRLVK